MTSGGGLHSGRGSDTIQSENSEHNNKNQNSVTNKGQSNATLWKADAAKTGQEEDAKHNLQFNTATCELLQGPFCPQNTSEFRVLIVESLIFPNLSPVPHS